MSSMRILLVLFCCNSGIFPKDTTVSLPNMNIAPRENQPKKNIREFHVESPYPTHTPAAYYTDATFLGDITSMILAKFCQLSDFFSSWITSSCVIPLNMITFWPGKKIFFYCIFDGSICALHFFSSPLNKPGCNPYLCWIWQLSL